MFFHQEQPSNEQHGKAYGSIAVTNYAKGFETNNEKDCLLQHQPHDSVSERLDSEKEQENFEFSVPSVGSLSELLTNSIRHLAGGDNDINVSLRSTTGRASAKSEIASIAKNLIGCGVLSLSGGMAIYSDSPSAIISASIWIAIMGSIAGYFCLLIAKVCDLTYSYTFRECWDDAMGKRFGVYVALVNTLNPLKAGVAYSTILSQAFQSLFATAGFHVTRIESLLIITTFCLLPLCMLKSIHQLAPFSVVGTAAVILTAISMVVRCLDGSYQPGGIYYDEIEVKPSFGSMNKPMSLLIFPFICMLFESFVMHYNSPRFYAELENASIPRYTGIVSSSFGLTICIYIAIAAAGFLTFGGNSDGFILNNYSPKDPMATTCRLCVAISTMLTFPLTFIGFRDGVLDLFNVPMEHQTRNFLNLLTVVLLSSITLVSCFVTDLGLINAVGGGTLACAIVFIFPGLMFQHAVANKHAQELLSKKSDVTLQKQRDREVVLAISLMILGTFLGLFGTYEAVKHM